MPDKARSETDKLLLEIERKLKSFYEQAQRELKGKWEAFAKAQSPKIKKAYDALQVAKKSGDYKEINKAQAEYERVIRNTILGNDRYKALLDQTTQRLAKANEQAIAYINEKLPEIYMINFNALADSAIEGYSFEIMDDDALRNLIASDTAFLPTKQLDKYKDIAWNGKAINSQIFQGILQGEDIYTIAARLLNVTDMNWKAAIRNARTMVTSVENKAKQDSFVRAEKDGIILMKRWLSMHDERTRDAHVELDGVEIPVNEAFENALGTIRYPGDPQADPANIYNCRCGIRGVIKGFRKG